MEYQLPSEEETTAVLDSPVDDGLDLPEAEKTIALKLINGPWYQKLLSGVEAKTEAKKAKELDAQVQALIASNKEMMKTELEQMRKANEPLTSGELEKLVSQEYLEFTVTLQKNNRREQREFILRELPVRIEKKIVTAVKKTLGVMLKDLSSLNWTTEMSNLERIQSIIEMVPGALETVSEVVAICLNPYGEEAGIDQEWVLDNMPVAKLLAVLQLQAEANRWRDFTSLVFRAIPNQMMG